MGALSAESFSNDDAWDWVNDYVEEPGLAIIIQTLTDVAEFDDDDYLELPLCGAGVAAAEVVAALNRKPHLELPEDLKAWVSKQSLSIDINLSILAIKALQRIDSNSEAQELWDESEYSTDFHTSMKDLEARVTASA